MQWLITGCSSGLGLHLARIVLSAGHKCIATSRNPNATPEYVAEIEKLGGTWVPLDVSSNNLENLVQEITEKHGFIDVLVNNAGFGDGGPLETYRY
jgi:NAD(P)-dependent dehydrogenase (short-subunit alcohol dehydrogenase family)